MPTITDSHAHLYWKSYDEDRADVLARAREAGVERMVLVGTDLPTSRACFELAAEELGLFPTAGIHPHDAAGADDAALAEIEALCRRPECVGVGETGLDFFKEYSPRAAQVQSYEWHLGLSRTLGKPTVIHCRDAHDENVRILRGFAGVDAVMHCYSFGPRELEPYLELGLYISFSGIVTYPKNDENRAAAALVPDDRILVETDCPFLSPQKKRGKRNEPAYVVQTLERVAEVRGVSPDELAAQTSANATRLFGLPES
ncbi:MAG: TatD family hydrolase [Planctomycetota bacterium]